MHHRMIESLESFGVDLLPVSLPCAHTFSALAFRISRLNAFHAQGDRKVHEDRWRTAAESAADGGGGGRTLREMTLDTPIRYAEGDCVESWLNELLCLDAAQKHAAASRLVCGTPAPRECELFWVDRDALFSHHALSEAFLQRLMSMYTAAHYKNSPNDLQLLSDAPAHELFVLLGPDAMPRAAAETERRRKAGKGGAPVLPDVLCVLQVAFEGRISAASLGDGLARGRSEAGDLIPWTLTTQFGDDAFAQLCGARVVRIATHPDVQRMGYGGVAMDLLLKHFKGELVDTFAPAPASDDSDKDDEDDDEEEEEEEESDDDEEQERDDEEEDAHEEGARRVSAAALRREKVRPRSKLPPLLVLCRERAPPVLHWCGVSFGATPELLTFWLRLGFELCYLRQTANDTTGEHTAILLKDLVDREDTADSGAVARAKRHAEDGFPAPAAGWLSGFVADARRRLVSLLAFTFRGFSSSMALSLLGGGSSSLHRPREGFAVGSTAGGGGSDGGGVLSAGELGLFLTPHDLRRLDLYSRNMADHHLVTDLMPPLAKLFFLGHLNGSFGASAEAGGEGGLSLSMVQKALLLGVGLQHRSVESLAEELRLPVSQVRTVMLGAGKGERGRKVRM